MAITLDGTTGISSVDGSAASPSVRGADANSGIVYAADTVKISTGGTERLEVDSSGNIDIPDNGKIRLGTGNDLSIYHTGSVSNIEDNVTNVLRISADSIGLQSGDKAEAGLVYTKNGSVDIFYDGGTAKLSTTSDGIFVNGKIAVGANASNNTINVSGAAGSGQTTLYYGFGTIGLTSASDERVKDNIVPTAKGLKEILELPIVDFTYKSEYSDDSTTLRTGGIAQEWQKIDTNLVNDENKDLLFINYKETIPILIKAVQELSAEVETLKTKVAALEAG